MEIKAAKRTILICGPTGVGKSAIIYRYLQHIGKQDQMHRFSSANMPVGTTLEFETVDFKICGILFKVVDTCGMNECKEGTVTPDEATQKLMNLIIECKEGINMVILVQEFRQSKDLQNCYELITTLIPKAPIYVIVQKVKKTWPKEICTCKIIKKPHFKSEHRIGPLVEDFLAVDLPGSDFDEEKFTEDNWNTISDFSLSFEAYIYKHSSDSFKITKNSTLCYLKAHFNSQWRKLSSKSAFLTKWMKNITSVLKKSGFTEEEASKCVKEATDGWV